MRSELIIPIEKNLDTQRGSLGTSCGHNRKRSLATHWELGGTCKFRRILASRWSSMKIGGAHRNKATVDEMWNAR